MIIAIEIHFLPEKGKRIQFRMVLDTEAAELKNVFFHLHACVCVYDVHGLASVTNWASG